MTVSPPRGPGLGLEDVLGPVRDQYLVAFLSAVRRIHADGQALEIEPIQGASGGSIGRGGLLNLPSRADCDDPDAGEQGQLDVGPLCSLHQRPYSFVIDRKLTCEIQPFVWNDVWVSITPTCPSALLMRMRLWFLDWFQSRKVDGDEMLSGALHRLDGPHEQDGSHWFHLDLGTAPLDSLTSLLDLLAAGQVRMCTIGGRPGFA